MKTQTRLKPATLLKKRLWHMCFRWLCKIFKNTFFYRKAPVVAADCLQICFCRSSSKSYLRLTWYWLSAATKKQSNRWNKCFQDIYVRNIVNNHWNNIQTLGSFPQKYSTWVVPFTWFRAISELPVYSITIFHKMSWDHYK